MFMHHQQFSVKIDGIVLRALVWLFPRMETLDAIYSYC